MNTQVAVEKTSRVAPASSDPSVDSRRDLIRVMHIINGQHYSGAERVQDLLATCLPEFGFEVGFTCIRPDRFPTMRRAQEAQLFNLTMDFKWDIRAAWKLRKLLGEHNYQIIHAHTPRAVMIGRIVASLTRLPLVYHVHSPTAADSTRRFHNWINARIEKLSISDKRCQLVTVSHSLADHMQRTGFDRSRITIVPNGVPIVTNISERPVPSTVWTLGTVALFRPRKGTEVLIKALHILRSRGCNVRLRAVGPFETPEYESALKQQVQRLKLNDAVQWTGFCQDVNTELQHMDLFVLPSLFGEGLPMVVLEAMSLGVPLVATAVEGIPEAVRAHKDGMIATPGDADNLAEVIELVIRGHVSWNSLRQSAIQRQNEQFSDVSMASGVARVYERLLEQG